MSEQSAVSNQQSAISDWTFTKDQLRVNLGCKRWEQWLEPARLLRVLGCSHHYAWNVQHGFQRRRASGLLLSPLDWLLLDVWARAGISLQAILRGIDAAFDRHPAVINSLAYCGQQIIAEAAAMKEAAVGAGCYPGGAGQQTLLIALPPSGKSIFAALQHEDKLQRVAASRGLGIAFTVFPDDWHRAEARRRFGETLTFLDPEPTPPLGSRRLRIKAGGPGGVASGSARSRQPFLESGSQNVSERRSPSANNARPQNVSPTHDHASANKRWPPSANKSAGKNVSSSIPEGPP